MNIPVRSDLKEDKALFVRLSRDPLFKQFRDYLTSNLDHLKEEAIFNMDRDTDLVSKGACQFITDVLNATDADRSAKVYASAQDK